MNQLSTFNRIVIVAGLFLIIALLGFFFLIQPKKNQEASTRQEIATLQQQYDELKRVADQKPLYLAFTQAIRSRLTGVEVTAQPKTYIPSYLKQIEDLASRDGLNVVTVTPAVTPVPSPGPSATPGSVTRPPQFLQNAVPGALRNPTGALAQQGVVTGNVTPNPTRPVTPGQPQPSAQGVPPSGPAANPARAAALAYLNQSFTQVPINMEMDGTYEQLEKFLRDLAKFPKLIGVGDVTLTSGQTVVGVSPRLKIVMPITAYRLSPNAPAQGPAPGPTPAPRPGGAR